MVEMPFEELFTTESKKYTIKHKGKYATEENYVSTTTTKFKMELFVGKVNGFHPSIFVTNSYILRFCGSPKYASKCLL